MRLMAAVGFTAATFALFLWLARRRETRPECDLADRESPTSISQNDDGEPCIDQSCHPGTRRGGIGQFDIAPGESRLFNGRRDVVLEASMESFPASDPPAF